MTVRGRNCVVPVGNAVEIRSRACQPGWDVTAKRKIASAPTMIIDTSRYISKDIDRLLCPIEISLQVLCFFLSRESPFYFLLFFFFFPDHRHVRRTYVHTYFLQASRLYRMSTCILFHTIWRREINVVRLKKKKKDGSKIVSILKTNTLKLLVVL